MMRNLDLKKGDILVVSYEEHTTPDFLDHAGKSLRAVFEPRGILVMFCPKSIELNSIHLHSSNYEEDSKTTSSNKDKKFRMLRADIEDLNEG